MLGYVILGFVLFLILVIVPASIRIVREYNRLSCSGSVASWASRVRD